MFTCHRHRTATAATPVHKPRCNHLRLVLSGLPPMLPVPKWWYGNTCKLYVMKYRLHVPRCPRVNLPTGRSEMSKLCPCPTQPPPTCHHTYQVASRAARLPGRSVPVVPGARDWARRPGTCLDCHPAASLRPPACLLCLRPSGQPAHPSMRPKYGDLS